MRPYRRRARISGRDRGRCDRPAVRRHARSARRLGGVETGRRPDAAVLAHVAAGDGGRRDGAVPAGRRARGRGGRRGPRWRREPGRAGGRSVARARCGGARGPAGPERRRGTTAAAVDQREGSSLGAGSPGCVGRPVPTPRWRLRRTRDRVRRRLHARCDPPRTAPGRGARARVRARRRLDERGPAASGAPDVPRPRRSTGGWCWRSATPSRRT